MVAEAVHDFHRQVTNVPRELVIVTDDKAFYDQLGKTYRSDNVVVVHAPYGPLGYLRNVAVAAARPASNVLVQWDDDDRYAKTRLEYQLNRLASSEAAACACYTAQLYYFVDSRRLYWIDWYNRRPRFQSVLIPGTIAVRRSIAAKIAYPAIAKGEDGNYLKAALGYGSCVPCDAGWQYIRRFHGMNTWDEGRFQSNARWLGAEAAWLRRGGRKEFLTKLFNDEQLATPGVVAVHGRDCLAYTFEIR